MSAATDTTTTRPDTVDIIHVVARARNAIEDQQAIDRARADKWRNEADDAEWVARLDADVAEADTLLATVDWLMNHAMAIALMKVDQ